MQAVWSDCVLPLPEEQVIADASETGAIVDWTGWMVVDNVIDLVAEEI